MSKLGLVILMLLTAGKTNAQNYPAPNNGPLNYFVLIQADDNQAFYVRLNGELYGSSSSGHLILSRLRDSLYTLNIGFPGQAYPEQRYLLDIHRKDQTLRLRQVENNWKLYDSQGLPLTIAVDPSAAGRPSLAGVKKDDAFSQLMSAIVQDTAVMYNTYTVTPDSARPGAQSTAGPVTPVHLHPDSTALSDSPTTVASNQPLLSSPPVTPSPTAPATHDTLTTFLAVTSSPTSAMKSSTGDSSTPAAPSAPTGVIKLSERKTSKSLRLVYTDQIADQRSDTIDVLIPVDSPAIGARRPIHTTDPARGSHVPAVTNRAVRPDTARGPVIHNKDNAQVVTASHFRSTDTSRAAAGFQTRRSDTARAVAGFQTPRADTGHAVAGLQTPRSDTGRAVAGFRVPRSDTPAATAAARKPPIAFINSDCHAFATDYDVDKLRIRMLDADKVDDRLLAARKVFKTKCFNTRQLRALSEVFATDAAKFKFLEAAYPFCSDDAFPELVSLFSDPVYTGRFRTMTDRH